MGKSQILNQIPNNILTISDIHIGSVMSQIDTLIKILYHYNADKYDLVVLNGDIIDQADEDIIKKAKELIAVLSCKKIVWIRGNHDDDTGSNELSFEEFKNFIHTKIDPNIIVLDEYELEVHNKKLLWKHGHQYTGDDSKFSRAIASIFQASQKIFGKFPQVYTAIDKLERKLTRAGKHVREGALREDADVIFCGHSHTPEIYKRISKTYINSGSCVRKVSNFADTMIRGNKILIKVFSINEDVFFLTEEILQTEIVCNLV